MKKRRKKIDPGRFVRDFGKTIAFPRKKPKCSVILAVAGPSRVGKTTVLRHIAKKLPYFVRIAHDDMRLFLYDQGLPDSPLVENFLHRVAPSAKLAEQWLGRGYGVMFDDNLATHPAKLKLLRRLAARFHAPIFVIGVWAPVSVVRCRLRGTRTLLFPDWRVGIAHFERSRKQFDYKHIGVPYLARVNTARPLAGQLRRTVKTLGKTMESGAQ